MKQLRSGRTGLSPPAAYPSTPWDSCKCIWPPKWVLMIMTHTIKELMHLLSYEQDLKSLEMKRVCIDAKFA